MFLYKMQIRDITKRFKRTKSQLHKKMWSKDCPEWTSFSSTSFTLVGYTHAFPNGLAIKSEKVNSVSDSLCIYIVGSSKHFRILLTPCENYWSINKTRLPSFEEYNIEIDHDL